MASGKSAYLEQALLNHVFGRTTWTPPATVYFALSGSPFDPNATGTGLDEPVGGAYARVALANNTTNFPDAGGSNPAVKATGAAANFPTATADWGVVQAIYAVDAATGGHALYGADLDTGIPVGAGSGFTVPAGSGIFTEV